MVQRFHDICLEESPATDVYGPLLDCEEMENALWLMSASYAVQSGQHLAVNGPYNTECWSQNCTAHTFSDLFLSMNITLKD